jgi:hypothetical protein
MGDDRVYVWPADVFRHPANWREISREQALAIAARDLGRVVVVFRSGLGESAEWLGSDHPFSVGVGPHSLRDLRYYRYQGPPQRVESGGTASAAPSKAPAPPPARSRQPAREPEKTWIAIELLDDKGAPVPGEPYEIRLPDGSYRRGSLDSAGCARIDGIDPGTCEVSFTRRDREDLNA